MGEKNTTVGRTAQYKHSFKVTRKELAAMTVYNCGSQQCNPGYQWGPGQRDHYLIHYVSAGTGTFTAAGETYTVTAGEAFLAAPGTIISYRSDELQPWRYSWVGFAGTDAPLLVKQMRFSPAAPVITLTNGKKFEKALSRIYQVRGSDFRGRVRMTGELYAALSLLMDQEKSSAGSAPRLFAQAVDYIGRNYFDYDLTVEQIAAHLAIDRSYLYLIFKEVCGLSPKAYLTDFRLGKAAALLQDSSLGIAAVANSVGYADSLYFSKAFKQSYGVNPTTFRREQEG